MKMSIPFLRRDYVDPRGPEGGGRRQEQQEDHQAVARPPEYNARLTRFACCQERGHSRPHPEPATGSESRSGRESQALDLVG